MIKLEDYLNGKKKELEKLNQEIDLFRNVKIPLKVNVYGDNEFGLFSENYSLAEDFKIEKRSEDLGGTSGYDGGYRTDRYSSYPQFYFNLKLKSLVLPVYIQHVGFDKDERVIIKSSVITDGWKDYSDKRGRYEESVDLERAFGFFRKQGVKENLLDKLKRRIKEAGEF